MPDLATTGSAIKIVRWLKQKGEPVKRGELILEIETDKAAMEVEATVDGVLRESRCAPGAEVAAGDLIAILEVAGGDVSGAKASPAPAPASGTRTGQPAAPAPSKPGGLFARNRAVAAEGRPAPVAKPGTRLPLSPARRTAARRLQESKQAIPHFYLETSASAEALIAHRNATEPKPAWDACLVRAVSRTLQRFELLGYRHDDGALAPQDSTNIGVAADIDGELFVVPIETPAAKGIPGISQEIRTVVEAIRTGHPDSKAVRPGLMTISNLGGVGAEISAGIMERFGEYLQAPVLRVASADVPVPFAPVLENAYRPDVPRLVAAVRDLLR